MTFFLTSRNKTLNKTRVLTIQCVDFRKFRMYVNYSIKNGVAGDDVQWIEERTILSNYDEESQYCKDPKIEIIDNRFLVFSRGGFMFGLYDLKLEKDTFNNCCPWNEWASQNIWAEKGPNYKGHVPKDEKSDYGLWIEKNIHGKIKDYIVNNK